MYTYIVKHLPKNSKKRPGHPMKPKYLTIHDTGNPKSTAQDEANWLTNPLNVSSTGFHIVVDEKNVIVKIINISVFLANFKITTPIMK